MNEKEISASKAVPLSGDMSSAVEASGTSARTDIPSSSDIEKIRRSSSDMKKRVLEVKKQGSSTRPKHVPASNAKRDVARRTKSARTGHIPKCGCLSNVKSAKDGAASHIKAIADDLKYDINAIMERDPAARSKVEAVLLYSGFHALAAHRLAHALNKKGAHFTARLISQATRFMTGIEIHPGATIGKGLFIDHGSGVVIGETAIVGDNCTIYQGVTLGGTGKESGKRHPTLKDNVMVGAGAKLLGNFTVGSGAKIAAGAVVLSDVAENSTAVGIPARIVRKNGVRVADEVDLDQTHIPDPVALQMSELQAKLDALTAQLDELRQNGATATDAAAQAETICAGAVAAEAVSSGKSDGEE